MQVLVANFHHHESMDYIYVVAVAMKNKYCFVVDFITLLKNSPLVRKNCYTSIETFKETVKKHMLIVAMAAKVKRYIPKCRQENVPMYYFDKVWHYDCHGS